jgi:hypothetical protein
MAEQSTSRGLEITEADRTVLRELARKVAECAALPVSAGRRDQWRRHNALGPGWPMMLIFPEGSWGELLPESAYQCESDRARRIEGELRRRIYTHEHFAGDNVVEATWPVGKVIRSTGWGLSAQWRPSTTARGAKGYDPVLLAPGDLDKLHAPEITYDAEASEAALAEAEELFGDILDVHLRGRGNFHFHVMPMYFSLRGLGQAMLDMLDNPRLIHDFAAIYRDGTLGLVRQYQEQGLLSLNNDGTYHSSGGVGYTEELPQADFDGQTVRPRDLWASAEDQELAQVSPAMHDEFALTYVKPLLEPFGLNGYGCCEDLTRKLDSVLGIPNLRRISISPWADVDVCAEKLGGRYLFSWKPHPAHLVGRFDEDRLRAYVRHTLEVCRANGCVLEMILKDTHTCEHRPERFDRWTRIARGEIEDMYG